MLSPLMSLLIYSCFIVSRKYCLAIVTIPLAHTVFLPLFLDDPYAMGGGIAKYVPFRVVDFTIS